MKKQHISKISADSNFMFICMFHFSIDYCVKLDVRYDNVKIVLVSYRNYFSLIPWGKCATLRRASNR